MEPYCHIELAKREALLETARIACARCICGRNARSMIVTGRKKSDKATLLNAMGRVAAANQLLVSHILVSSGEPITRQLYPEMLSVLQSLSTTEAGSHLANQGLRGLRGFAATYKLGGNDLLVDLELEPGLADSGIVEHDLSEMFDMIGQTAKAAARGWILLMDEMHCLSEQSLSALIAAIHRVSQSALPILLIGTGDPETARLAGNAKPYAERLFLFLPLGD